MCCINNDGLPVMLFLRKTPSSSSLVFSPQVGKKYEYPLSNPLFAVVTVPLPLPDLIVTEFSITIAAALISSTAKF